MLGLWQADGGPAGLPLAALPEQFDALEAFEDGTFTADGGAGLEAVVLGHLGMRLNRGGRKLGTPLTGGNWKKAKFFGPCWIQSTHPAIGMWFRIEKLGFLASSKAIPQKDRQWC